MSNLKEDLISSFIKKLDEQLAIDKAVLEKINLSKLKIPDEELSESEALYRKIYYARHYSQPEFLIDDTAYSAADVSASMAGYEGDPIIFIDNDENVYTISGSFKAKEITYFKIQKFKQIGE